MRKYINSKLMYTVAFIVSVACAVIFLLLSACLPQKSISNHVKESAIIMEEEGCYPQIADHRFASQLDNWTDSLILMESDSMNAQHISHIFTNPVYAYGGDNPVENFIEYVKVDNREPANYYVRYWMGFRVVIRLVLLFFNYYQLKRYLAFLFFCLFISVVFSIGRNVSTRAGWLFALSVILVRPYIICNSLQFSCCFFIAFIAMLMSPGVVKNPRFEMLFFMELGIVTMYFDFYTTPVITFGLPYVYMSLIRAQNEEHSSVSNLIRDAAFWLIGYAGMWLSKLLLTQLFTDQDAFMNGFTSLFRWTGIISSDTSNVEHRVLEMFKMITISILSDWEGAIFALVIVCVMTVLFLLCVKKKIILIELMHKHMAFLLPAVLPILWFIAAADPTRVHFWFQYRGIVVTYWTLGGYLSLVQAKKTEKLC